MAADTMDVIHLLVVDDEKRVLNALSRVFHDRRYKVCTAMSGESALSIIKQDFKPDVIISDMKMPQMTGEEFLINARKLLPSVPCIMLSGFSNTEAIINVLNHTNAYAYVHKPWEEQDLKLKVNHAASEYFLKQKLARQNKELKELTFLLEKKVNERTQELETLNRHLEQYSRELDDSYTNAVNMLAYFVDVHFPQLQGHSHHVASVAKGFAQYLGMPDNEVKDIETAGLLHDIGLMSVPELLGQSDSTQINPDILEKTQEHPIIGESIVSGMPVLQHVGEMIRSHHENYDGSGYPDGLKAEQIPFGARIIYLANYFDSLIHGYPQERSLEKIHALEHMAEYSGSKLDPELFVMFDRFIRLPQKAAEIPGGHFITTMHTRDLDEGMILYKSVYAKNGMLLLKKERMLTEKIIQAIINMESIEQVQYTLYVYTASITSITSAK